MSFLGHFVKTFVTRTGVKENCLPVYFEFLFNLKSVVLGIGLLSSFTIISSIVLNFYSKPLVAFACFMYFEFA